ncbi:MULTISPECIES: hypothetical protein [unclassified Adlercreutzia]|uniref:transmembrane-type terpene cyclase n=1 Tax=unclassified Adlercreutzia TaxID=2636013 RepID=UPI0013EAF94E|nr:MULTISPECIES: hypothetical protein [unclassified Adlercreutzia]
MVFVGISGLFWTIVYILIIRRDFADKTYGMPLAALAINIAWEVRFSMLFYSPDMMLLPQVINTVWALFDVVIVFTVLKFGGRAFSDTYKAKPGKYSFCGMFILMLAFCFIFIFIGTEFLATIPAFHDPNLGGATWEAAKFIAYSQNLLMSALFIAMIWQRDNVQGQSFWIAFCKWFGTFIVMFNYLPAHSFDQFGVMWLIFAAIEICDVWYMVLVWRKCKQLDINPLKLV